MPSVFLVSDTHFGHMGVCRFTRNDGVTKLRQVCYNSGNKVELKDIISY